MTKLRNECKFLDRLSLDTDLLVLASLARVATDLALTCKTTAIVCEKMQVLASTSILPLRRAATRARANQAEKAEKVENQKEERVRKETDHALLKLERTHVDPKTWLR